MAATTPESPGKADPEPFSPSVFLDLPPTPRAVGDAEDPAASSDDLVLPFISRMLMEEDIDDRFFYHYPDHPALLRAQQPYAQILSAAAAAAASDSFIANGNGSGACTLSASSDDAPSFTSATRPCDPIELSQLLELVSSPCPGMGAGFDEFTAHEANQLFLPQHDATIARFPNGRGGAGVESSGLLDGAEDTTTTTTSYPAGDGEHDLLPEMPATTFFSGQDQNRVDMGMLNQAFLRGVEEAKKFLPTDNSLLARGSKLSQGIASGQMRNEDKVDEMLVFQGIGANGQGRKNRCQWQCSETETGRSSKLMVPEPEETGEMIDEIIVNEYRLCLDGMLGLRVAVNSRDGKKIRKGNGKSALGRQSSNEVVDLPTLLIHYAHSVSMDDRQCATGLLRRIRQHSAPIGDANQRLAHCFAEGLEARLASMGAKCTNHSRQSAPRLWTTSKPTSCTYPSAASR